MRNDEILPTIKDDRDYRIFHDYAEHFIKRWAPMHDPRATAEFTADLMGMFRELIMTRHQIHCEVSAQYFRQSMDLAMMSPRPPVIVETEKKGTTDEG